MILAKKSLGQNFLIDNNIKRKITSVVDVKNKNIIEIGPGNGELTDEILKKNPRSLKLIEKDYDLVQFLKKKYYNIKFIEIYNSDILKFDFEKLVEKNSIIFGNLPYNISSQILVKIIKFQKWPPRFNSLIFMFQKELGQKILGKHQTPSYGRLSILTGYRLKHFQKFIVSPNCFSPKPKIESMVIMFKPIKRSFKIKKITNLEKITNILFSNKRKMIKKNLLKILNLDEIKRIEKLRLNARPSELEPEIYYKITELYEALL